MTDTQAPPQDAPPEQESDRLGEYHEKGFYGWAVFSLLVACVGALGFMAVYLLKRLGYDWYYHQWLGFTLSLCGLGIGAALIIWGKTLMSGGDVEDIHHESTDDERIEAVEIIEEGEDRLMGRRWLMRLVVAAGGLFGIAILFPVRSLGPSPNNGQLTSTPWRRGLRAIDADSKVITVDDFETGTVLTVYPEGFPGDKRAQALLLSMLPEEVDLPSDLNEQEYAPDGFLIYSKMCPHAGCPVGLYDKTQRQLVCPCHRSTFDASTGGDVVFGPAPLRLPMLPFEITSDGEFSALGDFPVPIGPAWWNRPDESTRT